MSLTSFKNKQNAIITPNKANSNFFILSNYYLEFKVDSTEDTASKYIVCEFQHTHKDK